MTGETTWLSPIMVVPKKNGKLCIYVDLKKLNETIKKDPYPLPFMEEVLDMVARHKVYAFLDGVSNYHHIVIALEDRYKTTFITKWGAFMWLIMPFRLKNLPLTYQQVVNMAFKEYFGMFMKLFLDDSSIFSDLKTHLAKLRLCFNKCWEFGISLNLEICMFLVFSNVILGYIMSKEGKQPDPKKIATIVNMPKLKTLKDIQVFNNMA